MSTKAVGGASTKVQIQTGTSTYTTVASITDFSWSGRGAATAEVTSFDDNGNESHIGTITIPGEMSLTMNYVAGDAGQAAMASSLAACSTVNYQITVPKGTSQTTSGDVFAVAGIVTGWDIKTGPKKQLEIVAKVKLTGAVTTTPGS